jgi:hypothetical protein
LVAGHIITNCALSQCVPRLYFPGFPVPAFPGIQASLHFPFPGEMAGNPKKLNMALFSYKGYQFFIFFQIMYKFFMMMAKMMATLPFAILIFQMNERIIFKN